MFLSHFFRRLVADTWASWGEQMAEFVGKNYDLKLFREVQVTLDYMEPLFQNHPVYALGYGSLLYSDGWWGRRMNYDVRPEDLIECKLRNYERGPWGLYGKQNFYGVIRNKGKQMNGCLVRIKTLRDWVGLMSTEMIVGLYDYANYRVVDVSKSVYDIDGRIEDDAVIHMVANRPLNRKKFLRTRPAWGYYSRVWRGVHEERSEDFITMFKETGSFEHGDLVMERCNRMRKEVGLDAIPVDDFSRRSVSSR